MQNPLRYRPLRVYSIMLACLSVLLNPWLIGVVFTPHGPLTKPDLLFCVVAFQIFCMVLAIGLWLTTKTLHQFFRPLLLNGAIVASVLLVCMGVLELVLRTGWFDNLNDPHPIWVPARLVEQNERINHLNFAFAANNQYNFNDIKRTDAKKLGRYRIAVLGDSFVWGDGVAYDDAWGHVLERDMLATYDGVEVVSWGKPGWSTVRELRFLKEEGYKLKPDLLIVGFVFNDLDLGTPHDVFTWQNLLPFRVVSFLFPNAMGFMASHLNAALSSTVLSSFSNEQWIEAQYTPGRKSEYVRVLQELAAFTSEHHIQLLFVLTPPNHEPVYERYHRDVGELLATANIAYLDLYPNAKRVFATSTARALWANPANPHPGPLLTHLYAQSVFDYITTHRAALKFTGR